MRWRIYYDDNSHLSESDCTPFSVRRTGVQVVAYESDTSTGFSLMHGKDCYYWRPDIGWQGCDMAGLWDYLMMYQGPQSVMFGRTLRDKAFWEIVGRAGREGLGQ